MIIIISRESVNTKAREVEWNQNHPVGESHRVCSTKQDQERSEQSE